MVFKWCSRATMVSEYMDATRVTRLSMKYGLCARIRWDLHFRLLS
jgi:hypothetical protein